MSNEDGGEASAQRAGLDVCELTTSALRGGPNKIRYDGDISAGAPPGGDRAGHSFVGLIPGGLNLGIGADFTSLGPHPFKALL